MASQDEAHGGGTGLMHTRHVRHDWKTWLDNQNQNSVRTLCGRTSKPDKCGIPGLTQQEIITVDSKGRKVWGWCVSCIATLANEVESMKPQNYNILPPELSTLYEALWQQVNAISMGGGIKPQRLYGGGEFWMPSVKAI